MPSSAEVYLQQLASLLEEVNPWLTYTVTVTTAGTEVRGPDMPGNGFYLKAHPDNTDTVWVGNNGSGVVSSATGFPLNPGEAIYVPVGNLNRVMFDADVSGEKVCCIRL